MMGFRLVWRLSLRRARRRPLGPALSVLGIAAGVGLMFAVQLVSARITGSYEQGERGIVGSADQQLVARSQRGLEQDVYHRVTRLPQVRAAAPITQHDVALVSPAKTVEVTLVGVDQRLGDLGGSLGRDSITDERDASALGLYLSSSMADRLGVGRSGEVRVRYRGQDRPVLVARVLSDEDFGALAKAPIAVAPLSVTQQLTNSQGRISRLLIALRPAASHQAGLDGLRRLAGHDADLLSIGAQSKLLSQASAPDRAGAALFSLVSLLVGALLAFNAMLLSVLERRREVAIMRMLGAPVRTLVGALMLEALLVGALGTVLGLAGGATLVAGLVEHTPVYLEAAFAFAPQALFPASVVVGSCVVGILATVTAALYPALIASRVPPAAALRGEGPLGGGGRAKEPAAWTAAVAGLPLVLGAALVLAAPAFGLLGIVAFVVGAVLLIPHLLPRAIRALRRRLPRPGGVAGGVVQLGVAELAAVPSRTTATAVIAAVTVMVVVVVGGLVKNIEEGTKSLNRDFWGYADLWLTVRSSENVFITRPFSERWIGRLESSPLVERAVPYRGAFLDWDGRRVLVFGVTPGFGLRTRNEVIDGDPEEVSRRLGQGSEGALAASLARARGLQIGDRFSVSTPTGERSLRLAGTISSYGWAPGALAIDARRFAELWGDGDVTAVQVVLAPGVSPAHAKRRLEPLLGPRSGLRLETSTEGWRRANAIASETLSPLRSIALAVGLAAVLAVGSVMLTAVAQRTRRLAALRAVGMSTRQVYGALIWESGVVLVIGALIGLAVGVATQALSVRWLSYTAGFHVSFSPEPASIAAALGFAVLIAVVAGSLPARRAAHAPIPPALAYE